MIRSPHLAPSPLRGQGPKPVRPLPVFAGLRPKPSPVCLKRLAPGGVYLTGNPNCHTNHEAYRLTALATTGFKATRPAAPSTGVTPISDGSGYTLADKADIIYR